MKKWMPILRTWILPMVPLLGLNVAFSPAYFNGDILDQDDIKLGWAKSKKKLEITERQQVKNRFGPTLQFSGMPAAQIPHTKYGGNIFEYITPAVRTIGGKPSST